MKYIQFIELSHIKVFLKEGFLLEIMGLMIKTNELLQTLCRYL